MQKIFLACFVFFAFHSVTQAQKKEPVWDNTTDKHWDEGFTKVRVKSTADGAVQKAWFHKTSGKTPQPLIVS
jgi:hypothetical protein